ncbi:hypothetical protein XENTR_v10010634 [Xenopus tropicalis]|nr:hypothetical protein XENTR_v10010634 [Xenopus tropicalis]
MGSASLGARNPCDWSRGWDRLVHRHHDIYIYRQQRRHIPSWAGSSTDSPLYRLSVSVSVSVGVSGHETHC